MGAAMLAAVGIGYYADIPSAVKVMAHTGSRVEPDPKSRTVYEQTLNLYISLYEALKPLFPGRMEILKLSRQAMN
jgi:xylulokinase